MNFGTIGAGTIGQSIAGHLVTAGHRVVLSNTRGPDTLSDAVARLGPLATAGTVAEAAAAEMVFLAVRWPDIPAALAYVSSWDGRILVDTSVPDPRHAEGRQLLLYAGDDADAKTDFCAVAEEIGFAPVDAGSLREGGRLSALHALKQD